MTTSLDFIYFFNDIAGGHVEAVASFIKSGIDVNYKMDKSNFYNADAMKFFKNHRGVTPLMTAALFDRDEIIKMLLDHGAKIETKTAITELTAPIIAVQNNAINSLSIMSQMGVDLKQLDKHGETLIDNLLDAQKPTPETLEFLLQQGIDPNHQDKDGCTAFMRLMDVELISPFSRDFKLWNLLLDYSVDLTIKNNAGLTVIDLLNKRNVLHVYPRIKEMYEHQMLLMNVNAENLSPDGLKF